MIGRTLSHYRLVEQIGMGGMATVYKAYDPDTDRYVAIKVLPEHFSRDPKFKQRFEREAKAIAKLEHLHILPLFAYGEEDGIAYMVMRYLKAGSLTERIQAGALPFAEASRLLSQIASALDHAHANGVLHRDVKPSNVLLDTDGNAFLTDFGIAKMVESSLDLTGAGILGTPAYMSPEQCRGNADLTPASDQYGLGIILYEMVTGRAPYQAETPIALIHKQLFDPLPMPHELRPNLPEEAEQVILKTLTKDPALRYPSCGAMAAAFARAVAQAIERPAAVDKDGTIISKAPAAVTTPAVAEGAALPMAAVVDEATMLHPTPEVSALVTPQAKRRIPVWALAAGVVVVLGLVAVLLVGLRKWRDKTAAESEATATPAYIAAQPTIEQPAAAAPPPAAPVESAPTEETPPPDLSATPRVVRPCIWNNHGPGLCIFLPGQEQPFKILKTGFTNQERPSWSPDGQRIVFSAKGPGDQDSDIYLVNPDGSNLIHLPNIENDIAPAWSPDGEWLAFHSSCNLAIMHPDGSGLTRLWRSDGRKCASYPEWSPDSRLLAAKVAPRQENFPITVELWVVAIKDGSVTPVAETTYKNWECDTDWAFSPDGAQVAYMDGDCKAWLVKADASGQPEALPDFPYDWQGNAYPQWAGQAAPPAAEKAPAKPTPAPAASKGPPGKLLFNCPDTQPPQLCIWDSAADQVTPLTRDLQFEAIFGMAWSPDGQQIVFDGGLDSGKQQPDHKLYLLNKDGSGLKQLTLDGDTNDQEPDWSPDGEWIVFHRNCSLWVVRPNGADAKMLLDQTDKLCVGGGGGNIQWSSDSQRIAFTNVSNKADQGELWLINRDSSEAHIVRTFDRKEWPWAVGWSPDGRQIDLWYTQEKHALVNADGSSELEVLDKPVIDKLHLWTWFSRFWPRWAK